MKKYEPKEEIEKLCEENKITFIRPREWEGLEVAELLNLVHNELLKFLERENKNGFYNLVIEDGEAQYPCGIKYMGGVTPKAEEEEKDYDFLNEGEIIYDNINQGEHNDFWYFGKFFKYNGVEKEGIITSYKDLFLDKSHRQEPNNEIKNIGLNYKHSLEINKNFWSNKSIKEFRKDMKKIDKCFVFKEIRDTLEYYMDIKDDRIFDIVSCWIIGTYCFELFESYGYLYFHALRESGKSKFKKILRLIGFNGQEASSISEASFFRTIENTKGVLCIDEYERMDTDRKKATDLLLNAGIEKGASVKRVDTIGNKKINRDFDVYCPKIICNITGLNPVTQTRCITIRLSRTAGEKGNRKPKTNDKRWQFLRDYCYRLVMNHWREIKQIYEKYDSGLNNRNEDVWLPVLVMANFFGVEKQVKEYAKTNIQKTQIESIENDRTYIILKELIDYYQIGEDARDYHLSDFTPYLKSKIDFGEQNAERVIGWHLTNLNIFDKGRDGKGITYFLSRNKILLAMISRGYPIPEKYQKDVKELHNTTNSTTTTTTTTTTQEDSKNKNYKENDVVSVVNVVNSEDVDDVPIIKIGKVKRKKKQIKLKGGEK